MRRGAPVLAVLFVLACTSCNGERVERSVFNGSGRVGGIEADAKPAEDPTGGDISGALMIDGDIAGLEDCAAADDGFRIYLDENTRFTPAKAKDDLDYFGGSTVHVSGRVTKDGDVCTPVADSIAERVAKAEDSDASPRPPAGDQ